MYSDVAPEAVAPTGPDDPRVTPYGRWLRSTSIDELPQLLNVLRGEMSLVGPRPEVPEFVACYTDTERAEVLSLRPGLTDPAALAFLDEERMLSAQVDPSTYYVEAILPQKIRLYRDYVRERSIWLDLKLIFRTLSAIASRG
jgi:lipopolysaccharide/colanic/teichoic acid biosynthesis glycosyltransferase